MYYLVSIYNKNVRLRYSNLPYDWTDFVNRLYQSRHGPVVQRLERMPYKRVMKFRLLPGPPFLFYITFLDVWPSGLRHQS